MKTMNQHIKKKKLGTNMFGITSEGRSGCDVRAPIKLGHESLWRNDRRQRRPDELWSVQGCTVCSDLAKCCTDEWKKLYRKKKKKKICCQSKIFWMLRHFFVLKIQISVKVLNFFPKYFFLWYDCVGVDFLVMFLLFLFCICGKKISRSHNDSIPIFDVSPKQYVFPDRNTLSHTHKPCIFFGSINVSHPQGNTLEKMGKPRCGKMGFFYVCC